MAINPYDRASWSTFTPLSSQEILQPAMMMRERHDRLDEEYAAIDNELQKVAFIAESENDPMIKQMYGNYASQLESGMNDLMSTGVTPTSKRRMLGLRSQFQSQIAPINQAYEMKVNDLNTYNQLKMKDPTWIGVDPSQRRLSDYLSNGMQPFAQNGISGALLTKMAADNLSQWSQILDNPDKAQVLDLITAKVGEENVPQYFQVIQQYGWRPGEEGHERLMNMARQHIFQSTGIEQWATPEQMQQALGYINQAETATIGKTTVNPYDNKQYLIALQRAEMKKAGTIEGGEKFRHATTELGHVPQSQIDTDKEILDSIALDPETNEIVSMKSKPNSEEAKKDRKALSDYRAGNKEYAHLFDVIDNNYEKFAPTTNPARGTAGTQRDVYSEFETSLKHLTGNKDLTKKEIEAARYYWNHKNKLEASIHGYHEANKEIKRISQEYSYLHEDPVIATKMGYQLEANMKNRSVVDIDFQASDSSNAMKHTMAATAKANAAGEPRLYELDPKNPKKRSDKGIKLSEKERERINKEGTISVIAGVGTVITDPVTDKMYFVDVQNELIQSVNKTTVSIDQELTNYKNLHAGKIATVEEAKSDLIGTTLKKGKLVVDSGGMQVYIINTYDKENNVYGKTAIALDENKEPIYMDSVNMNDLLTGGSKTGDMINEITQRAMGRAYKGFRDNPVSSGTEDKKSPPIY